MLIESIARVGATCEALIRLPQYVRKWGMNKAAREVARSLCGYLDGALDLHRNVQEESLFPALLDSAQNADGLSALVARFMAEHRRLEIAWPAPTLGPRQRLVGHGLHGSRAYQGNPRDLGAPFLP